MRHGPPRPSLETGERMGAQPWPPRLLAPVIGCVLAVLVAAPAMHLVWAAVTGGAWVRIDLLAAMINSGAVAAAATVLAMAVGMPLAWLVAATNLPAARAIRTAMLATLLVPPFAFALGWQALLLSAAPVACLVLALASSAIAPIFVATVWAHAHTCPSSTDAARLLSVPAVQRHVCELMRIAPALGAAAVLTFAKLLTDLGAPLVLATPNSTPFVTTEILRVFEAASRGATAAVAALLLCALVALLLRLAGQLSRRASRVASDGTGDASETLMRLGRWRWPACALSVTLALGLAGLPTAGLVVTALPQLGAVALAAPLLTTLTVATLAAALALVIAVSVAVLSHRSANAAAPLLRMLGTAPAVMPGVAIAIGLSGAYGAWMSGTLALLVLAMTTLALPGALYHLRQALAAIPPEEDYAARMLGADRRATFRAILLPHLSPSLIGAWALVFAGACRELPAALLLSSPHARTLAAESMVRAREGHADQAAAMAVALIAVSAVVVAIATRASGVPLLMPRR